LGQFNQRRHATLRKLTSQYDVCCDLDFLIVSIDINHPGEGVTNGLYFAVQVELEDVVWRLDLGESAVPDRVTDLCEFPGSFLSRKNLCALDYTARFP
jgi:hypothetical protein